MKKSIKHFASKEIKNITTVKGGNKNKGACEEAYGLDDVQIWVL